MSLQRLSVSVPLADSSTDPEAFVPVFHEWIRTRAVEGLLIDVARYGHVPDGPGVLLIGHEGDFSVDLAGGRPSLRYTLKRDNDGSAQELVERALARLLHAAREAAEAGFEIHADHVTVRIHDRLRAPNTPESVEALAPQVAAAARAVGGVEPSDVRRVSDDPREPVALVVELPEALAVAG